MIKYVGEEPIDLGDLLVIVAAKELSGKKNFSDSNIETILDNFEERPKEENEQADLLRRKLLELVWHPDIAAVDAIVGTGKKCNPNETVFAYQQNTVPDLPHYIWMEIGNTKAGMVHMIKNRRTGGNHYKQLKSFVSGLNTFNDFFNLIEGLLKLGKCKLYKRTEKHWHIDITVNAPIRWQNLIIDAGIYRLPIGNNGFMVSLFPTGKAD